MTVSSQNFQAKQQFLGINSGDSEKLTPDQYESLCDECVILQNKWNSLRTIADIIGQKYDISISKNSVARIISKCRKEQIDLEAINNFSYQRLVSLEELSNLARQVLEIIEEKVIIYKIPITNDETGETEMTEKRVAVEPGLLVKFIKILHSILISEAQIRGLLNHQVQLKIAEDYTRQNDSIQARMMSLNSTACEPCYDGVSPENQKRLREIFEKRKE